MLLRKKIFETLENTAISQPTPKKILWYVLTTLTVGTGNVQLNFIITEILKQWDR
jgi:uncharacterized membrane protein (DUF106 family)